MKRAVKPTDPHCDRCGHKGYKVDRWSKYHHDGGRPVFRCDFCGFEWMSGTGEPYLNYAQNAEKF